MKYVSKEFRIGACIIAIETTSSYIPYRPNSIYRYYRIGDKTKIQNGKTIGSGLHKKTALIIFAKYGDILKIKRYCPNKNDYVVRFYKVGKNYKPIPFANKNKFYSINEISKFLDDSVSESLGRVDVSSSEETKIYASKWPSWLGEIIERHQRTLKMMKRIQRWTNAGEAVNLREIKRIVRQEPGIALEFFSGRLDKRQFQKCIETNMLEGILYAFEEMTEEQITLATHLHAEDLLRYQADKLSIADFRICVDNSLDTAIKIRSDLNEQQHAVVMSMTLKKYNWFYRRSLDNSLLFEALTSLSREFHIWNETYNGDHLELYFDLHRVKIIKYSNQQKDLIYYYLRKLVPDHTKMQQNMDFFFGSYFTENT